MTALTTAQPIEQLAPNVVTKVKPGDLSLAQNILIGVGVALLGLAGFLAWQSADHGHRFYYSYLTAYMGVLGISLGALVFVMIQHIVRAGWSVVIRRLAENIAAVLPWMLLLFLPVVLGFKDLHHHWLEPKPGDTVIAGKTGFLNTNFFFVRVALYFTVWIGLATYFRRMSLKQDQTGDPAISLRLARVAALGIVMFALTITFAAIDWIMILNPHWFSTIFGITYFAGAYMAFFAFTILMAMWLGKKGYLKDAVSTEHYHDLAKLMFTFVVFWTYTNFSQYMLIWYANLPEETAFYSMRKEGGWSAVGTLLIFGHFLVPFAFLMSRHIKRNPVTLAAGAIFLLVIHWIDMQYLILPNYEPHTAGEGAHGADAAVHGGAIIDGEGLFGAFGHNLGVWLHNLVVTDFLCFAGLITLVTGIVVMNVRRANLLPTRDPRLAESLGFQNH